MVRNAGGLKPVEIRRARTRPMGVPVGPRRAWTRLTGAPVGPRRVQTRLTGAPVGPRRARTRPTGAKSPLNVLNYFFGGYAMAEVFRQQPRTIQRAMDNFRRRCEACVAAYGGAFEYFLDD